MKYQSLALTALLGLAAADSATHENLHARRNLAKRQVPQEHSHEIFLSITREFLNLNNPKGIADVVFGFLGNAAAAQGAGQVTNLDCLKQETADQAFTNAKAKKDIRGMSAALVLQALERNTGKVGQASVLCTDKAVNPEIAALTQHQDAASPNAAATNKAITLELAKQLALIGGDPLLALESGTFAPGNLNDNTGKGNSCDTIDDPIGCIFTQKLLVLDASPAEISAAVKGITPTFTGTGVLSATHVDFNGLSVAGGGKGAVAAPTAPPAAPAKTSCSVITTTVAATAVPTVVSNVNAAPAAIQTAPAAGVNVQAFSGSLGGPPPAVISAAGPRPFSVDGDTFVGAGAALGRSCDKQHNACANAANSGKLSGGVKQCDDQNAACRASNNLRKRFYKRQATNFGSCSDPSIVFKSGLADRKEAAFIANNQADFNHGSAQKIGIIAGFICQRLADSCKAPTAVQQTCAQASSAAVAATQDQTAANTFNNILIGGVAAGGNAGNAKGNGKGKATGNAKENGKGKGKGNANAGAAAPQVTPAPVAQAAGCAAAVVMTITQCS